MTSNTNEVFCFKLLTLFLFPTPKELVIKLFLLQNKGAVFYVSVYRSLYEYAFGYANIDWRAATFRSYCIEDTAVQKKVFVLLFTK